MYPTAPRLDVSGMGGWVSEPWDHIHSVCDSLRGLRTTSVAVPELSPSHAAGPTPIKAQITKVISLSR